MEYRKFILIFRTAILSTIFSILSSSFNNESILKIIQNRLSFLYLSIYNGKDDIEKTVNNDYHFDDDKAKSYYQANKKICKKDRNMKN